MKLSLTQRQCGLGGGDPGGGVAGFDRTSRTAIIVITSSFEENIRRVRTETFLSSGDVVYSIC
jgi:hypothetical protein